MGSTGLVLCAFFVIARIINKDKTISDDSTKKPTKKQRTKKKFNNNNCCWTHGYDLRDPRHTSETCEKPWDGHIRSHTGTNPAKGASTKFKDLSIYKDIPIPE